MRFAPKINLRPRLNVRTRLTLAFFFVIALSWLLNVLAFRYIADQEFRRFRAEMAARGINITERRRHHPEPQGFARLFRGMGPPNVWQRLLPIQGTIALILALGAGAWVARRITRPLRELEEGAHAFHESQFEHRIPQKGYDEFARVAATMNEMANRVEAQFSALEADAHRRQQLLADVAHELRSPVATLKTMAEAMRDGVANQPERRERALCSMVAMSERLQRLVTDLMDVAKLDLHELPLHCKTVDLAVITRDTASVFSERAAGAGITVHPVAVEGDTHVEGDALRLTQIIENLLGNAIDHAGRSAEVSISVSGGNSVSVVVADTGRGISAQHLPYLFDPFYRADAARTPGDLHSGLGLRIARGLAEAHGGTLTIESDEGRGTRAVLTLPSA